jgi:ornithine cyclodeaminase/alanine dehydrogenase-like protein (mu-crystallin family)
MSTLLLTRSHVEALLDTRALVEELRTGFIAYSAEPQDRALRVRAALPGRRGTATVLFPGVVPGVAAFTVKVRAKFPSETPAIRGVLCVHDMNTGALLAIMDSTYLTAVRTGIAGALAADVLARKDADAVAVVGAGVQGAFQLRALAGLRTIRRVWVYDLARDRADEFARRWSSELSLSVEPVHSVSDAVRQADIVLTATWATTPFIVPGVLAAGAHVTSLGPDEPGKAEVSADVIKDSLFVCDDRHLAVELGALRGVGLGADAVSAELGEVLGGSHPGRTSREQITVYGGVGLAFQDAVAAWHVYRRAKDAGTGTALDFLG